MDDDNMGYEGELEYTERDSLRRERRQVSMLQGVVESFNQRDMVQLEYWIQVINKNLGRTLSAGDLLQCNFFDVTKESNESCWVLDIKDDVYGFYVYFINLSNKQANLKVDGRVWVKTPIFLRRGANRGIYLDVGCLPPEVMSAVHMKGIEFKYKPEKIEAAVDAIRGVDDGLRESGAPEPKGDCSTCIHRVDSNLTDRDIMCALKECEYETLDSIRGRYTVEL